MLHPEHTWFTTVILTESVKDWCSMRIAITVEDLTDPNSDTARFLSQLITELGKIDGVNEYLMLSSMAISSPPTTPSTFSWEDVPVNGPSEQLRRVRWDQRIFPDNAKKRGANILFVPSFAPPSLGSLPTIVTIPDLLPFTLPEYRPNSALWMYHQFLTQGIRRSALIMTHSEFMKAEVIRQFALPSEQVTTIGIAPLPQYKPVVDQRILRALRLQYHLGEQFVVYAGGFDIRKNIPLLIGAFAAAMHRLGDTTTRLLLAGDEQQLGSNPHTPDWRSFIHRLNLESRIVIANIPTEDLPAIYSMTNAFIYPSQYEGTGMDVLHAMACGAPIITSNVPALLETTGNAGLWFTLEPKDDTLSPKSIRALTTQITRMLETPDRYEEFHQRSLARARFFSWSQIAVDVSAVFSEIIGSRN